MHSTIDPRTTDVKAKERVAKDIAKAKEDSPRVLCATLAKQLQELAETVRKHNLFLVSENLKTIAWEVENLA